MEKQVQILTEGDELQQNDVNRMGEAAGLAEGSNANPGQYVLERAFVG